MAQLDAIRNGAVQQAPTSSSDGLTPSTGDLTIPDDPELLDPDSEGYHGREPPTTSVLEGLPDIVDRGFLTISEAENLVSQFKSRFVWTFPFVVLDPAQTVADLRKREPLLFLAVIAATIASAHPIRKLLADEIMQHVTSRIVASSERNLGLVRALLVLCAWYRYPAQRGNVQLVLLITLCTTMVHDLGLHRLKMELTMDQQRALLGTYLISSSLQRVMNRPSGMENSKKIEECCDNMAASTEHPSDRYIRSFILTQTFINTIYVNYGELGEAAYEESLVKIMIGAKLREFESLKATLEEDLSKCPSPLTSIHICNMHFIDIAIRSMALGDEHACFQNRRAAVPSPSFEAFKVSAYRSSLLWHLVRYSKALIQAYIEIPDGELPQVTVFTLTQICASLVYLPRSVSFLLKLITTKQSPHHGGRAWPVRGEALEEARAVVDEADFLNVVVRLYEKLRVLTVGLTKQDFGLDVAGTLCCHVNVLASWYAPRVRAILGVDLVDRYPLTTVTPAADAVVSRINAADSANGNGASISPVVDQGTASTYLQQGYPGAYTGAEDGIDLFSDEMWASVLDSFTNFV